MSLPCLQYKQYSLPYIMLTSMYDCRKLKEDAVPTVAFADFASTENNQGTLQYYLTAAFSQVYAQQNVLIPFTGKSAAVSTCLPRASSVTS